MNCILLFYTHKEKRLVMLCGLENSCTALTSSVAAAGKSFTACNTMEDMLVPLLRQVVIWELLPSDQPQDVEQCNITG